MSSAYRDSVERGKQILVRQLELTTRVDQVRRQKRSRTIELQAPLDHRDPTTGRRLLQPTRELIEVGRYFRQARFRAGLSQDQVSRQTGVSQSMVSRFERGFAPGMRVEKLVALALAVDRLFPFGICPHEHDCAWQPIRPPEHRASAVEALIATILEPPSRDETSGPELEPTDEPTDARSFIDVSLDQISHPA